MQKHRAVKAQARNRAFCSGSQGFDGSMRLSIQIFCQNGDKGIHFHRLGQMGIHPGV